MSDLLRTSSTPGVVPGVDEPDGLVVVGTGADLSAKGTKQPQDHTDHGKDAANGVQDADVE